MAKFPLGFNTEFAAVTEDTYGTSNLAGSGVNNSGIMIQPTSIESSQEIMETEHATGKILSKVGERAPGVKGGTLTIESALQKSNAGMAGLLTSLFGTATPAIDYSTYTLDHTGETSSLTCLVKTGTTAETYDQVLAGAVVSGWTIDVGINDFVRSTFELVGADLTTQASTEDLVTIDDPTDATCHYHTGQGTFDVDNGGNSYDYVYAISINFNVVLLDSTEDSYELGSASRARLLRSGIEVETTISQKWHGEDPLSAGTPNPFLYDQENDNTVDLNIDIGDATAGDDKFGYIFTFAKSKVKNVSMSPDGPGLWNIEATLGNYYEAKATINSEFNLVLNDMDVTP